MSRVFVAREMALGRDVVVKVLPDMLSEGSSRERFQREILLSATLQHPNIIGVIAAGDAGELPYFVMPFVEGESVRAKLRDGPISIPSTVAVLRDVARALAFAHGRGIVHRDIKPDNILLTGGAAVVADFGVAKALDTARHTTGPVASSTLTRAGSSLGTPAYMAPEQVAADPAADHRVDIYALGITAYEMLTGTPPFRGDSLTELLTAQLTKAPQPISELRASVPMALHALIMRCLEKDPSARPQTASELLQLLDDPSVVSGPLPSMSIPATNPSTPAQGSMARRSRGLFIGIAVGIALVAGALAILRPGGVGSTPPAAPAIAVLPFTSSSADSSDAYVAMGLTDELTNALTRVPGLRVASRGSAAGLIKEPAGQAEAAKAQGITMLLEGTVQRRGDRIRVNARLINVGDGFAAWSDVYERAVTDLFTVQADIATSIAAIIRADVAKSGGDSMLRRVRGETPDPVAYDEFLRGHYLLARRGGSTLEQAVGHFDRAIARDSTFARAYAELSQAYAVLPLYANADARMAHTRARAAAQTALRLDSALAPAWAALGYLHNNDWEWKEGRAALDRAVALDSGYVSAHQWLGENLIITGDAAGAERAFGSAMKLDQSSVVARALHAVALACLGRLDDAVAEARTAAEADPSLIATRFINGSVLAFAGRFDEAIRELQEANTQVPDVPTVLGALGYSQARAGKRADAEATRRKILSGRERPGYHAGLAKIALGLGEIDVALTHLEQARLAHDGVFSSEPLLAQMFDGARTSAGFRELVVKLGLDPVRLTALTR